jgi:hypothetical protein
VPDLEIEEFEANKKFEEKEAKRDQTWDEFLSMFTEHIEGKIDPLIRTGGRKDKDIP